MVRLHHFEFFGSAADGRRGYITCVFCHIFPDVDELIDKIVDPESNQVM